MAEDERLFRNIIGQMDLDNDDIIFPNQDGGARRGGRLARIVNEVDLNNAGQFQIDGTWRQLAPEFNMHGTVYNVRPTTYDTAESLIENIASFLRNVTDYMRSNFSPSDQISCEVTAVGFDDSRGGGVGVPFVRLDQFSPDFIISQIEDVIQSNEAVEMDDGSFRLQIFRVVLPGAGGRVNPALFMGISDTVENILKKKRALVTIPQNIHPFCVVAAMWGAKRLALHNNIRSARLFKNSLKVKRECREILRQAGLGLSRERVDLDDVQKIANTPGFLDHPVVIFSRDHTYSIVGKFNRRAPLAPLYLLLNKQDIFIIRSLSSLLNMPSGFFCLECEQFSRAKLNHVCNLAYCRQCKTRCDKASEVVTHPIKCDDCRRFFKSPDCYQRHKQKGSSPMYRRKRVCSSIWGCSECKRDIAAKDGRVTGKDAYSSREHRCFKSRCSNCGGFFEYGKHLCMLRKIDLDNPKVREKYRRLRTIRIFFDVETEKLAIGDGKYEFGPICVVSMHEDEEEEARVFYGEDCMQQFLRYVHVGDDSLEATGDRYQIIAHNAGKFDAFLAVKYFMKTRTDIPRILFNGNKILKMQSGKITWLDSVAYLQCALRQVPKLCGLDIDLRKGFFPHDFNIPENRDYVGPLPPKESFGIKFHKKYEIEEFDKWYKDESARFARENCVYDLKAEMVEYCKQDVRVLMAGFKRFDANVESLTGFRCGEDNCTMAGLANLHLRSLWPDKRIGQVPVKGYGHQDVQSREGLAYMMYLDSKVYGGRLQHAKKGEGEARINVADDKTFKVDGFDATTNTIEEFAGCMWHGCIGKCYTPRTKNPITGRSLLDCRQEFQTRNAYLREAGYTVNVTWECDFKKRLREDEVFAQSIQDIRNENSNFLREPFELRKALFGGRTEAFKLLQEADPELGESIEFVDVTSLYPSRMAQCEYPWGHPTILTNVSPNQVRKYRGLFHVKVLPVKNAYIPWLPARIETPSGPKLVYTNCVKCATEFNFNINVCNHSEQDRALTGIYTSDELFAAMDSGYKVLACYEVWHYHTWTTLTYKEYVQQWMKVKQEASGYPAWADTLEKKRQYIENYERDEGIKLDPNKIEKNDVLRKIAKLFLNSSWGFWGRNRLKKKKQVVRDPDMFFKLMCDSSLNNKRASWLSEDCLLFEASVDRESLAPDTKGSLVHAIFTTALARVLLTKAMFELGERTIYGDTDSIVFFKDQPTFQKGDVTLSDRLGGWTKVEEEGIIIKMVCGGPKNYGYQILKPDGTVETRFKVRGITLNSATEKRVNFETLQNLVWESKLNDIMGERGDNDANGITKRKIEVPRLHFNRIFKGARGDEDSAFTIRPEECVKTYKLVFDKRVLDAKSFFTFPFGYVA